MAQPSEKARIILQSWYPNVSKQKLTLKDLRFVVKALKTLSSRWEEIGMTVDVKDLDKIKKDYRGTYKRLIAVINFWLSGNYHEERDGSNAPSWWKIVDAVADDIGGGDPNLAKNIAQNWRDLGTDKFSPLALKASNTPLSCQKNAGGKLIIKIATALQGVASKWFEIATLLGIHVDKLNAIKEECDGSTEACLREVIKEWLTGGYDQAHGYPTPSVRVLVDVVEHQAGGADPSLAKELTGLNFSTEGSSGALCEPSSTQAHQLPPSTCTEQRAGESNCASARNQRVHGSGSSEEALQLQVNYDAPSARNLSIIKWKNERGEVKKFRLRAACIHKWRPIGYLVVPRPQLEVWSKEKDSNGCCEAVFSHWLDHPPPDYPATWDGLYELLDDSELGEVATELRRAVENAVTV